VPTNTVPALHINISTLGSKKFFLFFILKTPPVGFARGVKDIFYFLF
jgi:hypothetical protein